MQVYVLSLKDSIDRQKSITTQCEKLGIEPVFIDAVNGRNLTDTQINQYCDQKKAKQLFGRELLLGEIGCALSHKKIYQKIVNENIPYAVILEDDAVIKEGFTEIVESVMDSKTNWDLVLLGHHKNALNQIASPLSIWYKVRLSSEYTLKRLADFGYGTYGYIISNQGANKLLLELVSISRPIDHYTCDSIISNIYAISPTVVEVNYDFDNIIDNIEMRLIQKDKIYINFLKKVKLLGKAISVKNMLKTLKPIKKYK